MSKKTFLSFLVCFFVLVCTWSLWATWEPQKCTGCTNGTLEYTTGDVQSVGGLTTGADKAVTSGGNLIEGYNAVTIAAGTGAPAYTISSPTKAMQDFTCSDTDGCNIWLAITGATNGQLMQIANAGSNNVIVNEGTTGAMTATTVTLGADDTISFVFRHSLWTELGAANN